MMLFSAGTSKAGPPAQRGRLEVAPSVVVGTYMYSASAAAERRECKSK